MAVNRGFSQRGAPLVLAALVGLSPGVEAALIGDSSATLQMHNIYLNRDFREGTAQSKREEWAQGFWLTIESGFTEGAVGLGVDAIGMLGIKLDSGGGRVGTGLLPLGESGAAPDQFGRLGLTGKLKLSATELRYGSHLPKLPVVKASDSRTLPQLFEGALLSSSELAGLRLVGGRFDKVVERDRTSADELRLANKNQRFDNAASADALLFAGAEYAFSPQLTGQYYVAQLEDVCRQQLVDLLALRPVGKDGKISAELRLAASTDQGAANAGKIENQAWSGALAYALPDHRFTLGLQQMHGATGFAYLDGTDPHLLNYVQINDFANADERSWQLRYDFDFAAVGVPGLSFLARYVHGEDADYANGGRNGSEWERNLELRYVVPQGPLKNLSVRLRHATLRSDFARDADEHRVIIAYSLPVW